MKLFKILASVAMMALLAAPAFAASTPRDVRGGLIQGEGPDVVVFEITNGGLDAVDECLNINGGTTTVVCDNLAVNQYSAPKPFKVNNMRITVSGAGDASSTCDAQVEVNAVSTNTVQETAFSVVTVGVVFNEAQNFVVREGDLVAIMVNDDSGCVTNTAPVFTVQLEGQFL
jgi:hypothetical protein